MLLACGALAAGEYLASFVPHYVGLWPVTAVLCILVALFGFGLVLRGWWLLFFVCLGVTLYFRASGADEQIYRENPWMRGCMYRNRIRAERQELWAREVKRNLAERMAIGLSERDEAVALSRAILLGERRGIPSRTRRMFVESGTIHIFAISGLHVMAIAEALVCLLALVMIPRRLVGLVVTPVLWGYVWLIGWPPSAIRAVIMASFSLLAPVFWRRPNGLRSWALTFLVVHLVRPLQIVDVGNALSFAVMLAIVSVVDLTREMSRAWQTLCVTVAAWAIGVPIAAHVFGRMTPGGMLANLVLIGAAKLAVCTGVAGLMVSVVSSVLAAHFNNLCALVIHAMILVAKFVSELPFIAFETGKWTVLQCCAWYAGLAVVVLCAWRIYRWRCNRL